MSPEELQALAANYGEFYPQAFPLYYTGSAKFVDNANGNTGVVGARANVTVPINNDPHILYGVRITNIYELPLDFDPLARPGLLIWDDEQTVRMTLAQGDPTAQALPQVNFQGRSNVHLHPFVRPYPFRGGNNVQFEVTRLTSYPVINDEVIEPTCFITLVAARLRADLRTAAAPGSTGRPA